MESNRLAVVIPAYNEELTIYQVVSELIEVFGSRVLPIVVNDCSSDNTSIKAKEAGATVIDLKSNSGYAGAINEGLKYAVSNLDVTYIATMDADGQHNPICLKRLFETALYKKCDIIVGVRQRCARISEQLYAIYFNNKFDISDPLSGMKIYSKSLIKKTDCFETYDSIGTEILTTALVNDKYVIQSPINIRKRQDEQPRFGSTWSANKRIVSSLIKTVWRIGSKRINHI